MDVAGVSDTQMIDVSLAYAFLSGRFTDAGVVTVKVGSDNATFHVHGLLLTNESTFFASALDGNYKEAAENEVKMPEEDPATFEYFVQWLYHGLHDRHTATCDVSAHTTSVKEIVNLYVLGDKIGCLALKKDVVSDFYHLV